MHALNGEVHVQKGMEKAPMIQYVDSLGDIPMAIHFRWKTHGKTNEHNCHPFKVTDNIFMMHNGILANIPQPNTGMSDSWHYAKYHLKYRLLKMEDRMTDPAFLHELKKDIGSHNKIVLLRNDGKFLIANEHKGVEWKGLWLSNEAGVPDTLETIARRGRVFITGFNGTTVEETIEKKTNTPATPGTSILLGGDTQFIGYLVRTPEYYGLPPKTAYMLHKAHLRLRDKNPDLNENEKKWVKWCHDKVTRNRIDSGVLPNMFAEHCQRLQKDFEDQIAKEQLKPKVYRAPEKDQMSTFHGCTDCGGRFTTKLMWFTVEQNNTPIRDREGVCNVCFEGVSPQPPIPVVHTGSSFQNRTTNSSYKPYVQKIEWNCSICNDPGYCVGSWASGDKETPVCYKCNNVAKERQKKAEMVEAATFCGVVDKTVMTPFEINYWKGKSYLKDLLDIKEVIEQPNA